ncbi:MULTISPECIES: response regulator transcription factor [Streptacidiphilus]|uniref:Response regulator transcription factor n=2 Tax=Streptacidiphilus TaxID=228398 RepID=A0ABV6UKB8_9ACTN|nr:response regulator transcription factor [Streptacidiphilus jeojiense]
MTASISTPSAPKLLIVEDDRELGPMLSGLFASEGYAVDLAADGQQGLHLGLSRPYQVMVVDRRLPGIDGLELLGRLRRRAVTARVLILTALGDHHERVRGLDGGADDYLVKPFHIDELVARVRALTRRFAEEAKQLPIGTGRLDVELHQVELVDGSAVQLSPREFDLLLTLALRPRSVHSRAHLRARVFADTSAESLVDTYVYYLRRKLGREAVLTVHGYGYQIGTL